jgi:hypothetical protein
VLLEVYGAVRCDAGAAVLTALFPPPSRLVFLAAALTSLWSGSNFNGAMCCSVVGYDAV